MDSADRFPFVVEIMHRDRLICSGTVLYPRIVVTSAHCLQQKASWRGGQFFVNQFLSAADLSVDVVRGRSAETHKVSETLIAPGWRRASQGQTLRRFSHDLALLVTERPIDVEAPPNPIGTPERPDFSQASAAARLPPQALLVAFGEACSNAAQCEHAGKRRFAAVTIKESTHCFRSPRDRDPTLAKAVWCIESNLMPGDSGGALLIKPSGERFYFVGVISAQQNLPIGLAASWRRSIATSLYPNLAFILEKAKELGYLP